MSDTHNLHQQLQQDMQAALPEEVWKQAEALFKQDMEDVERDVRARLARGETAAPPEAAPPAPAAAPKSKRMRTNFV